MMDIKKISANQFHLLQNNTSYNITVLGVDWENHTLQVLINDQRVEVKHETDLDKTLKKMGFDNKKSDIQTEIFAPMPGLILDVLVKENQQIIKGDSLAVIEAMKMENVIKVDFDCFVKKIHVSNKDKVEKNTLLFEVNV
tara:strand:+ start:351 stop:770 length:420 start_codon:yes stop_codon:yes gene_type:complete